MITTCYRCQNNNKETKIRDQIQEAVFYTSSYDENKLLDISIQKITNFNDRVNSYE
jgi:hypothetical protein